MARAPRSAVIVWLRRLILAVVLAVCTGYLPLRLYGQGTLDRYFSLRRDLERLRGDNARVRLENVTLKQQLAALREDAGAVERVARDELGLVREGEIVFQLEAVR